MKTTYYREQRHICGKDYDSAGYMEVDLYSVTKRQHQASRERKEKKQPALQCRNTTTDGQKGTVSSL